MLLLGVCLAHTQTQHCERVPIPVTSTSPSTRADRDLNPDPSVHHLTLALTEMALVGDQGAAFDAQVTGEANPRLGGDDAAHD